MKQQNEDNELIQAIRKAELEDDQDTAQEATGELLEKYKSLVRRKTRPYYIAGADGEDVLQEGMIGLYKAIVSFDPSKGAAFSSFAELCIERQIKSAVKLANRKKHEPLNKGVSLETPVMKDEDGETITMIDVIADVTSKDPQEDLIGKEETAELLAAVREALSPMELTVLDLFLQGKDYREIAKEMDISVKSADNALQRIRLKTESLKK